MLFGNRGPRSSGTRQRRNEAFRPRAENLEAKLLLAIDLGGAQFGSLPAIATAPFGVQMVNTAASQGAGWSVRNLGSISGSGFDAFLIGAPSVAIQNTPLGSIVAPVAGNNSEAYLVFGSQSVTAPTIQNWLNNSANQRVGELFNNLGNLLQTNPITGTQGYDFAGVKFITSQAQNSLLGASGAFAGNINGQPAFLIGAPNAPGLNTTTTGFGRVYLVYGSGLSTFGGASPIDLDLPGQYANQGITIVTIATSVAGSQLGTSVAGLGNFLATGSNAIALGAPGATVSGQPGSGAVYVVSNNVLAGFGNGAVLDASAVGQSGGITGLVLAGASSGDQAGFSVASAGNVNGTSGSDSIIIGAPRQGTTAGSAFLVYGGSLGQFATTVNGYTAVRLGTVGATGGAPGAIINGTTAGDFTGYAVSSAGDFNSDGFADFMIGSPGFATGAGLVSVFYGAANNAITGTVSLAAVPSTIRVQQLTGAATGNLAGFSLSQVSPINSGQPSLILIGAPGFNASQGTAYLLPGRAGFFTGTFSLSTAEASPLFGVQFFFSTPGAGAASPPFFGASVSGRLVNSGQTRTADADTIGDFIIGAPGLAINSSTALAGGASIVEGAFITVQVPPPATGIVSTIVRIDDDTTSPFAVNATTPNNMDIYITRVTTTTPPFDPVRDIDPTTIVVNGVAFPNATVRADPNNTNNAIITISPRSSLGLTSATTTLTVTGQTLASSPLANQTFSATGAITVQGGNVVPPFGGFGVLPPPGQFAPSTFNSPFGTNFVPTTSSFSALNYAPIPLRVALDQYLPPNGFRQRINAWQYPSKKVWPPLGGRTKTNSGQSFNGSGVWTLGSKVFTRGRFHPGSSYAWTHSDPHGGALGRVVPTQLARQRYTSRGSHLGNA